MSICIFINERPSIIEYSAVETDQSNVSFARVKDEEKGCTRNVSGKRDNDQHVESIDHRFRSSVEERERVNAWMARSMLSRSSIQRVTSHSSS